MLSRFCSTSTPGAPSSCVDLSRICPVVLVGGRSRRFGRDKLLEPLGDGRLLVSVPIAALRAVFGSRVAVVGACNRQVAALADELIPDPYPGQGPGGGILAALEYAQSPVFVLSGDLANINADVVRAVAVGFLERPNVWASLAWSDRLEPCIGVYAPGAISSLRTVLETGAPLRSAIPGEHLRTISVDSIYAHNVNRPGDLPGQRDSDHRGV